jgi:hypothetical protein
MALRETGVGIPGRPFDTGLSKPLIHIHNTVSVVELSKLFKTCRSRACPWDRTATYGFRQSLDSVQSLTTYCLFTPQPY